MELSENPADFDGARLLFCAGPRLLETQLDHGARGGRFDGNGQNYLEHSKRRRIREIDSHSRLAGSRNLQCVDLLGLQATGKAAIQQKLMVNSKVGF